MRHHNILPKINRPKLLPIFEYYTIQSQESTKHFIQCSLECWRNRSTRASQTAINTIGRLSDQISPSTLLANNVKLSSSSKVSRDCGWVGGGDADVDGDIGKAVLGSIRSSSNGVQQALDGDNKYVGSYLKDTRPLSDIGRGDSFQTMPHIVIPSRVVNTKLLNRDNATFTIW